MEILSVVGRNVNSFYFIIIIIYLDERESKVYEGEEIATLLFSFFIFPSFPSAIPYDVVVVGCSGHREREEERKVVSLYSYTISKYLHHVASARCKLVIRHSPQSFVSLSLHAIKIFRCRKNCVFSIS